MLEKRKFCFICVFHIRKTSKKSVFIIRHENIIFQDMLLSPPNRRLRMAHEDVQVTYISYLKGTPYHSFINSKYIIYILIIYYIF